MQPPKSYKIRILNRTWFYYLIIIVLFYSLLIPEKAREQRLRFLEWRHAYYPVYLKQGLVPYQPNRLWRARQYFTLRIENLPTMIRRGEIDDPSSILAESHSLIGFCSYYLLRPDKAIEHYLQAIQYKNDFSGYYFNLGLIYYNLGDFSKAIVNFKKAVSLSAVESTVSKKNEQTPEAAETVNILNEGQKFIILSYEAARDYQSMLEAARSAVDENKPDKIFYYYYAGKAAAKTGEYAKAADFLNQCLILAPWHADAYRELAFSLQELHQMESADQMMQQAQTLQAAPDFQQYQKLLKIQPFLFF